MNGSAEQGVIRVEFFDLAEVSICRWRLDRAAIGVIGQVVGVEGTLRQRCAAALILLRFGFRFGGEGALQPGQRRAAVAKERHAERLQRFLQQCAARTRPHACLILAALQELAVAQLLEAQAGWDRVAGDRRNAAGSWRAVRFDRLALMEWNQCSVCVPFGSISAI